MRLERPRVGEILAGLAGAVLLGSLFLPWYGGGPEACAQTADASCPPRQLSGWSSLAVLDLLLVAIAVAGLALLGLELTRRPRAISVALAAMTASIATLAVPWLLVRALVVPEAADGLDPRLAFLGLLATAGVALGAWLSMRDEGFGLRPGGDIEATINRGRAGVDAEQVTLEQVRSRANSST